MGTEKLCALCGEAPTTSCRCATFKKREVIICVDCLAQFKVEGLDKVRVVLHDED